MAQAAYDYDLQGTGVRVSWRSVFAGLIIGLVSQALLTMLGMAVGLNAIDPATGNYGAVGIGSGIWLVVTALVSTFIGGWVASSLASVRYRLDGMIHGVLTWGMMMIVTLYLIGTGLGMLIGGSFNLMSAAVTGTSYGVAQATTEQGVSAVRQQIQKLTPPQQQAQRGVSEGQAAVRQEQAADTASRVAWFAFLATLLSLIAGAFGGMAGYRSQRHLITGTEKL